MPVYGITDGPQEQTRRRTRRHRTVVGIDSRRDVRLQSPRVMVVYADARASQGRGCRSLGERPKGRQWGGSSNIAMSR